jgi:WD40 repeat protein
MPQCPVCRNNYYEGQTRCLLCSLNLTTFERQDVLNIETNKTLETYKQDNLNEKIEDLENKLNDLVQCLAQGYYPTKLVSAVRVTKSLEIETIQSLKVSVTELIDVYNSVPNILTNNAVNVSVNTTTNSEAEIILEKSARGNYWIIATEVESRQYWLLPNGAIDCQSLYKKLFNKYSINAVKTLFNFESQELSADKNLIIEQPAQVTFLSNSQKWKLKDQGSIQFGIDSHSSQLKNLEELTRQHQHLNLQLNQLQTEIAQLKAFLQYQKKEDEITKESINLFSVEDDQDITNQTKNIENIAFSFQETQQLEFVSNVDNPEIKTISETDKWQSVQLVHELTGHKNTIRTLAITNWKNNNEKQIIISGSFDKTIKIWSLNQGKLIKSLDLESQVNAIIVTPDGNSFISGGDDGKIQICDIDTARHRTIDAHAHRILAVAISPDGKTIFSGSRDHSIKPWNYDTGKIRWNNSDGQIRESLIGDYGTVIALDISLTGEFLASSTGDNIVRLWELNKHKLLPTSFQHSDLVWSIAISPDGLTLVSGCRDNTIKIWDIKSGEQKHNLTSHSAEIWAVAISPNGQFLASASGDHTIKLWNLNGDLLHSIESHSNGVYALAFSPDSEYLVSASKDQTIKIWR